MNQKSSLREVPQFVSKALAANNLNHLVVSHALPKLRLLGLLNQPARNSVIG
jgi:hypothetical protein